MYEFEEWEVPTYEPEYYEVVVVIPAQIIQAQEQARLAPPRPLPMPVRERDTDKLRKDESIQPRLSGKGILVLLCIGAVLLLGMISHAPSTASSPATGTFGLDYVSGPPPAILKTAGVSFVCRYLSEVNPLTQGKLLTRTEATSLSNTGIALVSTFEWTATRALEGYNAGVQDAQIAAEQHATAGGPQDRPIYFSVDSDVAGEQVAAYFQGVASVIGIARTGAYGSYRVLKYLFNTGLIMWGWQTYAWSYGAWEPHAQIQQYQNSVALSGHSVDYDRATTRDFGQWL